MKEELRAIDRLRGGVVDAVDVELPVAGVDRARERDLVADLQAELAREDVADDRAAFVLLASAPCRRARPTASVYTSRKRLRIDGHASRRTRSGRFGSLPPNQLAQVACLTPGTCADVVDVALGQRHDERDLVPRARGGPWPRTRRRRSTPRESVRSRTKARTATAPPSTVSDRAHLVAPDVAHADPDDVHMRTPLVELAHDASRARRRPDRG